MSKRFGRNQRRTLRDRIAALEVERLHHGRAAPVGAIVLDDGRRPIKDWELRHSMSTWGAYAESDLTISLPIDEVIHAAVFDSAQFSFRGRLFMVMEAGSPQEQSGFLKHPVCELRLRGL